MRSALTIAGSDPTGGAGLQADLQVFRSHGIHGAAVATALTIQDSVKVHKVLPVFPSVVLDQLRILLADFRPTVIKLGMLASDDVARNVLLALGPHRETLPVVIDPVLFSSDGTPLLERRAWPVLQALMAGAALVTPNLVEAGQLTDVDASTREGSEVAVRRFIDDFGARAVLLKGGHRAGAPDDLLAVRESGGVRLHWLAGERIDVGPVHGTGCALSAAVAAGLAAGQPLEDAVDRARAYVADAIRSSEAPGRGARFLIPRGPRE